jgi:NAD(P)H-hydrate repair Nnr-like enzyme with NAD(P)H-hydrate epimerase domain
MLPWISLGAGSQSEPDEESRGHNVAAQVLRFTETGTADPSFANPTFHYSGTGGSGVEALVHGVAVQANGDIVEVGFTARFMNLVSGAMLQTVRKLLNTTGDRMNNRKTDECFEAVLIIDAAGHDLT